MNILISTRQIHLKQRKRWVGVLDKVLCELVEPRPSLGSWSIGHRRTAHGVVTGRIRVASSIALTTYCNVSCYQQRRSQVRHTWLNPDQSVDQGIVRGGCRTSSKAGVLDVAPLAPLGPDRELTCAALVDDEVGRDSLGREEGGEGVGVVGFVPGVAPLGEVLTGNGNVSCIVISIGN